jgi:hypothetical protein
MRESCLQEFDAHWQCLEKNNQYFQACRKPEKTLNDCVFKNLVSLMYLIDLAAAKEACGSGGGANCPTKANARVVGAR